MINFFNKLYCSIKDQNTLLCKLRYYSCIRFLVRSTANVILPIYFRITKGNKNRYLNNCSKTKGRIIVSLTSFPARIGRLWLVIETLLRQTIQPEKIILWLAEEQFPGFYTIPKNLIRLQKNGLEIRICPGDMRSHKKYYYALQEFPDDIIITVDDDVFYDLRLIEYLVESYNKFPNCVSCNHCSEIKISNGKIQPYILWKDYSSTGCPSYKIFTIGIGGVLYPPRIFNSMVFNSKVFMKYCEMADDIWLNVILKLSGAMAVKSNYNSCYLPVMNFRNFTLSSINVNKELNDKQLVLVRNYCTENLGIDPFQKLL